MTIQEAEEYGMPYSISVGDNVYIKESDDPTMQVREIDCETGDLILGYGPEQNVRRVRPNDVVVV